MTYKIPYLKIRFVHLFKKERIFTHFFLIKLILNINSGILKNSKRSKNNFSPDPESPIVESFLIIKKFPWRDRNEEAVRSLI